MKVVTKEYFFLMQQKKYKFLRSFSKQINTLRIVGKLIEIHLSFEVVPFLFSIFLKSGGYRFFDFFLNTYTCEGVCVAIKSRGFGSSFVLRNVSGSVMYDRAMLFFSPLLVKFKYAFQRIPKNQQKKHFKAKLYYSKAYSQKSLLANLFK